jgi:NADP-dependent 3-hydroxy acid dehydrogenase YdfG
MKMYRISEADQAFPDAWHGGLSDTKHAVKALSKALRRSMQVDEINVQTDKPGVVAMLNGEPVCGDPLRTWTVTARGALQE